MAIDKRTRVMLAGLLRNGELYGAHQKYRTTAARLLKTPAPSSFGGTALTSSKSKDSSSVDPVLLPFDDAAKDAAELLYEGSKALLEKGELGGGTDLALYLLDTWKTRGVKCDSENRNKIQLLIALVGNSGKWRKAILEHAMAWSTSDPETPAGDPALHAYIGQVLHKDRDYFGAEQHYLAAQTRDSAKSLAVLLFEWYKLDTSSNSSVSTLGRYAARGALSYLETYSILCANVFLESFIRLALNSNHSLLVENVGLSTWPEKPSTSESQTSQQQPEIAVTKLPSLNFLQLLVKTCQVGLSEQTVKKPGVQGQQGQTQTIYPGKTGFVQLLQKYEREVPWLKEPEVKESTAIIGEMYFNIKPSSAGGANILGDLMSSLFGGGGGGGAGPQSKGKGRGRGAGTPQIGPAGLD